SVGAAAHHHVHSFARVCQSHSFFKNRNHAVFAAGALIVVVVHVRLEIPNKSRIVVEPFLDHYVRLLLIQTERMFDSVAACDDRVLLALSAQDVARSLMPEPMRFIDQRLKYRHRIRELILRLTRRSERVSARREQFDPIHSMVDMLPYGSPRFFNRLHENAGQRILWRGVRGSRPDDSAARYLKAGPFDASVIDRVADIDVRVAIAMGAHITCG